MGVMSLEIHKDDSKNRQPVLLLRNHSYPTYQLCAVAGGKRASSDTVLKIVILETMKWLRERFRAFELPQELEAPEPDEYEDVELRQFGSFSINWGYKLEVVWLPEQKIWALQLTEPDLGTRPGEKDQPRLPVPGRLLETNISYRWQKNGVKCAFQTIITEPEGGQKDCEVFRFALVRRFAHNPLVGLRQTFPLTDVSVPISDTAQIKRYQKWIADKERTLPVIVFAEYDEVETGPFSALPASKKYFEPDLGGLGTARIGAKYLTDLFSNAPKPKPSFPVDVADLAKQWIGYAQFFVLKSSMKNDFAKLSGRNIPNGGVLICDPLVLGGGHKIHTYEKASAKGFAGSLGEWLQNYPRDKDLEPVFNHCIFVPKARDIERQNIARDLKDKDQIVAFYAGQKELQAEEHGKELTRINHAKNKEIGALERDICLLKEQVFDLREEINSERSAKEKLSQTLASEIERRASLRCRPRRPQDVSGWVGEYFEGTMVFHKRAKAEMGKLTPGEVDMDLLCDALEYLGTEYWSELNGLIDQITRDDVSGKKYGRPFSVTPTGTSPDMYRSDYSIKYKVGYKGKLVETPLDLHLKVGVDAENLLRIYFLYDKDKHLIVVGSLPHHLPTVTYKT